MVSSVTGQAIDELIAEMSSAAPELPRADAHNWVLHGDLTLPATDRLSPLVDAIRRIADVQDGLAATLERQGEQMRQMGKTQDTIVKDLAKLRNGTPALDDPTLESGSAAFKHPDATVRILSAAVRRLQTNQAEIRADFVNLQGKVVDKGKQPILPKENEKPAGLDKMDVDLPTGPSKGRVLSLALRPHVREIGRQLQEQKIGKQAPPEQKKTSTFGSGFGFTFAGVTSGKEGEEVRGRKPIEQIISNVNTRCQSLEQLRKRDFDILSRDIERIKSKILNPAPAILAKDIDTIKDHLATLIGQREHTTVVNHLRSTVKVEVLEQQMVMVLQVLADSVELPREVVYKLRKCTSACQDLENRMAYWRQRLQMATTVDESRLLNSVNSALGELRLARSGSPGPPNQPNAEGMDLLISVGEWMLKSYAGILRARKDFPLNALPEPPAPLTRKRVVAEADEYHGRLKRRPVDEPPHGITLFSEVGGKRSDWKEPRISSDYYTPETSKLRHGHHGHHGASSRVPENNGSRGTFERGSGRGKQDGGLGGPAERLRKA